MLVSCLSLWDGLSGCRSMNSNSRLAEIVEAAKALEQAVIRDSGVQSECLSYSYHLAIATMSLNTLPKSDLIHVYPCTHTCTV